MVPLVYQWYHSANGSIGITIGTNGITNGTIGRTLNDIGIPLVPFGRTMNTRIISINCNC